MRLQSSGPAARAFERRAGRAAPHPIADAECKRSNNSWLWCKLNLRQRESPSEAPVLPSCKHRIPNSGRIAVFESQLAEIELTFMDLA